MGKQVDNNFTWVIKNFTSSQPKIYSDEFLVDGCKWRLMMFPKGNNGEYLSLFLDVAGSEPLPIGWRRLATMQFTIVNQLYAALSQTKATYNWFDSETSYSGFTSMFPLEKLHDGFVVNGELKIVAVVDVLEIIGDQDVSDDELEEATNSSSRLEDDGGAESSDFLGEVSSVKESIDVNGFQILPSQVKCVRRIFEKHPEIASDFRLKNQHLRSAYMSVLLGVIKTLCQSTQELSKDDLTDADAALGYLIDTGLNLNWLEEKLEEVSEKKENEEAGETRMQEIEEEMKELKLKCSDLEAQMEKEKENVFMARAPMSFDDLL